MTTPEEKRSSVEAWLKVAAQDLRVVEMVLAAVPPLLNPALFHAQQAAEKHLKAFLVSNEVGFPKTHDLKFLLELCLPLDPDLVALREACFRLTEYAVEPRYPMPGPELSLEQTQEAVADAKLISEAILGSLSREREPGGTTQISDDSDQ